MTAVASPFRLHTQAAYRMAEDEELDAEPDEVEAELLPMQKRPVEKERESDGDSEGSDTSKEEGSGEGEEEEDSSDHEVDESVTGAKAVRSPKRTGIEECDEAEGEPTSDGEDDSSADEEESTRDSTSSGVSKAEDWTKSDGPDNASVEVATRDNCV